jgi:hypothetical protein
VLPAVYFCGLLQALLTSPIPIKLQVPSGMSQAARMAHALQGMQSLMKACLCDVRVRCLQLCSSLGGTRKGTRAASC